MAQNQVKVTINGITYEVEIGDLDKSPATVIVNGIAYQVEIEGAQVREARKSISETPGSGPKSVTVKIPQSSSMDAKVNPGAGVSMEVKAPMPGTILDIQVKPGDVVNRGDQLCALEAMKMKSLIRSPRVGTIEVVEVTEGQKVSFGDILFRFR
jgi:glutaconyl-CoA/methylmalonyl-CoA decarboxylase subunit gamma